MPLLRDPGHSTRRLRLGLTVLVIVLGDPNTYVVLVPLVDVPSR